MNHPSCERKICINWRQGRCSRSDPEKVNGDCLDFEDAMDFLRLKTDAVRGTLG